MILFRRFNFLNKAWIQLGPGFLGFMRLIEFTVKKANLDCAFGRRDLTSFSEVRWAMFYKRIFVLKHWSYLEKVLMLGELGDLRSFYGWYSLLRP